MKWGAFFSAKFTVLVGLLLLAACAWRSEVSPPPGALVLAPPPATAVTTLANLQDVAVPENDRVAVAAAYQDVAAPRVARENPPDLAVGDRDTFWVKDFETQANRQVTAVLRYGSPELLLWVEESARVDDADLAAAAARIEGEILPTSRTSFGREWSPGVDGDPRLTILHVEDVGGVATAYFDYANQYVTAVNAFSNQREMLTVGLKTAPLGSITYYSAITHELQHLIQWGSDGNEEAWLNEGMAELASLLAGFPPERADDYAENSDVQLTNLSQQSDVIRQHYAAATLFATYFYERFGLEAVQALARQPANGAVGFDAVLAELGSAETFETFFADWLAANADPLAYSAVAGPELDPDRLRPGETTLDDVHQFGADYYAVRGDTAVTAVFTGTQQVGLFPASAASGSFVWMSYPADESAVSLTRAFDLSGVDTATLTFNLWYRLEAGWDYGYTAVSTNDGQTWTLLETEATTRDNPQGNSIGPGYTGSSDGWISQQADLSPFAGQEILLRFLVLTDTAVHETGLLIDDVAIPEIGFSDDMEDDANGWQAAGFVRVTDVLPQKFIVQSLVIGQNGVEVASIALDERQQGRLLLPAADNGETRLIVVAGATPVTRETAVYRLTLEPVSDSAQLP